MTQPYRETEIVVPLVDYDAGSSPFVQFRCHEKALATLDIYRQDIAACGATYDAASDLRALKFRAKGPRIQPPDADQNVNVLSASAWLQGLTIDDIAYFQEAVGPKVEVTPKKSFYVMTVLLVLAGGVLGFVAGFAVHAVYWHP